MDQFQALDAFRENLAKALGYQVEKLDPGYDSVIVVSEGLWLSVRADNYGAVLKRVEVSAYNRASYKLRDRGTLKWPSATVAADRPAEALAKDVDRRVVQPAREVNADMHVRLHALAAARAKALRDLEAVRLSCPGAEVKVMEDPIDGAQFYVNITSPVRLYLSGRVSASGEMSGGQASFSLDALSILMKGVAQKRARAEKRAKPALSRRKRK
jgi:hypothetical protein